MNSDRTVFLDRDGTINIEKNYLYKTEDFSFIPYAPEAISLLNQNGYRVIVVSNQAGVARGIYSEQDVEKLHRYIADELKKWDARIDKFYYCPHHPTAGIGKYRVACHCRKPGTGLFEQACRDYLVNINGSWMIGDNCSDMEAGKNFHLKTILVRTGYGQNLEQEGYDEFDYIADDLYTAVTQIILNGERHEEQSR